ncbi:DNA polymerase III delta subunit [hydrothermal vent metagenome]|uniref:DNA-directed DNA polymerase n=1 Tax=hydrothermal vent metagenome TaxID=652676 RepID=A0A3B0UT65_9ZZZZ
MPLYKKDDINKVVTTIKQGKSVQLYLIVGERFLCRQAADRLCAALIPEAGERQNIITRIDGDEEEPLKTLALLKSFSLFAGRQVFMVTGSRLFQSKETARAVWNRAVKARQNNDMERAARVLQQFAALGGRTIEELTTTAAGEWRQLFGFPKPNGDLSWLASLTTPGTDSRRGRKESGAADKTAAQYMAALTAGIPTGNVLILMASEVDKRKKLFKFIKEHGVIIDLAVGSGSARAVKDSQEAVLRELIQQTLNNLGKKMAPRLVNILMERAGFHPVAVVRETEKLALYVDDAETITINDLDILCARTREDAVYEFTEAFGRADLRQSLLLGARMMETGTHPLALIAALRNYLRKLLVVRSFIDTPRPVFVPGMTYGVFQKGYLTEFKELRADWLAELPKHPYALFMMFEKASKMAAADLIRWQRELLNTEYSLKSSAVPPLLVFEGFLFNCLTNRPA